MLQLYDYYRSSSSFRVRIALHLKNLAYEKIPVHLVNQGGEQFSSHYQSINPQSLVPTLKVDNQCISQSFAIIEYLDEVYPEPPLLPKDPYLKAMARGLALIISSEIQPLNNLRVLKYLTADFSLSEEQKLQWYHHWLAAGLLAFERKLTSLNISGKYSVGDEPSLADIFLVPQLYNARRYHCDLSAYPTLLHIDAHCQQQPAFLKAWPAETENTRIINE